MTNGFDTIDSGVNVNEIDALLLVSAIFVGEGGSMRGSMSEGDEKVR